MDTPKRRNKAKVKLLNSIYLNEQSLNVTLHVYTVHLESSGKSLFSNSVINLFLPCGLEVPDPLTLWYQKCVSGLRWDN